VHQHFKIGLALITVAAAIAIIGGTMAVVDGVGLRTSAPAARSVKLLALKAPKRDMAGLDEPPYLQAPVSDTNAFDANQGCLSPQQVIDRLQADREAIGGKLVVLAEGLQQSFSNGWRLRVHVAPVQVSSVVAHLFPGPGLLGEWSADIVEFDANGSAMSRTLVPGDLWNGLLEAAFGVQA